MDTTSALHETSRPPDTSQKASTSAATASSGNPPGANQGRESDGAGSSTSTSLRPHSPQPAKPSPPLPARPTSVSALLQAELGPLDLPAKAREPNMNPPSRPLTPRTKVKTPRSLTPMSAAHALVASEGGHSLVGPAVPRSPNENGARQLNVSDALGYLDAVKLQFQDKPDVYNHFLDIMKDFKSQSIDTPGVINRVSMLFHGNPLLIHGFNTFLPPGYRIDLSSDPRNLNTITVTTPMGTTTQTTSAFGGILRLPRETIHQHGLPMAFTSQPPFGGHAPPPILPVGLGPGSRPTTPLSHAIAPHAPSAFVETPHSYSSTVTGAQSAAASLLGGLNGHNNTDKSNQVTEFNHAIQFLNKIKVRFSDEPDVYKQFLDILQTYQKEQKQLQLPLPDTQVYAQVSSLFRDAPELMQEFTIFMPEALGLYRQAPAGLVGIMPHPSAQTPTQPWEAPEAPPVAAAEKVKAPSRRRKRAAEKEQVPPQKATTGRANKRAKLNNKPEASPKFSPYHHPPSPEPLPPRHTDLNHPQLSMGPPQMPGASSAHIPHGGLPSQTNELTFFQAVKQLLDPHGNHDDFMRLLIAFSKGIINSQTLIERSQVFLDADLLQQLKDVISWDDKQGDVEYGPPGSIRTSAPDPQAATCPDDDDGPSYRRLPHNEIRLACSGRDQLAWSVLNDEWVSHPTWASEESGFLTHKKTSFEETLHRSEEERHEYQVHIDAITRTIAVLEPLDARIEEMSAEERAQFRLGPELGGWSPAVYQKTIKKVYGRDHFNEIYTALQESPSTAVPIVLSRLKQKSEEWRRAQRDWNRTWREVDAKNFYKALDHQGITFKANDKKNITAKALLEEIKAIKTTQLEQENQDGGVPQGFQLEYEFHDKEVLRDTHKMIYTFLDHSTSQYSSTERRTVEQFLQSFLPTLFCAPTLDFDSSSIPAPLSLVNPPRAGDGDDIADLPKEADGRNGRQSVQGTPSTGVPAGDLRKRLLKTVQDGTIGRATKQAQSTGSASPIPEGTPTVTTATKLPVGAQPRAETRSTPGDMWVSEIPLASQSDVVEAGDTLVNKRPFFTSTTFYTLLRLLQLLYSRLLACKEIGAQMAREKHKALLANPVAIALGLDEPNGPSVVLGQALEAVGESSGEHPNVLYIYFLDACEKVFANELDQATFEEHMRWFFRTKAYYVFTIDKVITAIIKQAQTILVDNKCQELWDLLQAERQREKTTLYDTIRYRREAERHVGSDDHLYRIECDRETRKLRIQLLGTDDPSADEDRTALGRWKEYVASYVLRHPTEWLPRRRAEKKARAVFLKRTVIDGGRRGEDEGRLRVRVSLGSCRLFYEGGSEDVWRRRRDSEEQAGLAARARAREEERRRSRWLK